MELQEKKTIVKKKKKKSKTNKKSNMKAIFGIFKGQIIEKEGCWDDDLKK